MEYRIVLTNKEAVELSNKLKFLNTGFVKDEYNCEKRIRTDSDGISEAEYKTPVKGALYRFSSEYVLGSIDHIWFKFKWTDKKSRFEIEFEREVPEEFKNRTNVSGWDILG